MKKQLQKKQLFFVSLFVLLLASCQVEEGITNNAISSGYSVKDISKNEIDSNLKIANNLQKLSSQKNDITAKKGTFSTLGLTIQTDHAKYIENGNYHSYTFATVQNETDNIKNVLFSLNEVGEYDAYLVQYDYNKLDLEKFDSTRKPGKASLKAINLNISSLTSKTSSIWVCEYEYILVPAHQGDLHPGGEDEWVLVSKNCYIKYAVEVESEYENYSQGTASITTSGSMNTNGGGSIATSPNVTMFDEDELIKVNFVKTKLETRFIQNIFLDKNGGIAFEIYDYLVANRISSEAIVFAKQLLEQMRLNPGLYLDIEASSKSPINIDRLSIPYDLTKPENQKFNEVYDALTQSPEFKKMFIDMFQNNTHYNVKFMIGNIVGSTSGITKTDLNNPTLNTITISPTFLNSSNKMEIAKTIIHEFIHAYLNVKLCDAGQGISIPTLNNLDYFNVVNQKYNGFNGSQDQHNFIYTYMLPILKTILTEIKDTLVTSANNLTMLNDISVHIPLNTSPSSPFIWNDYYHNLALSGLQSCAFFQNEIGTITVINGVPTVTNTVNQTLMQSYNEYTRLGQQNIHP